MTNISGMTAIWAILADPIHHVKTPEALNAVLRDREIDGVLIPVHVVADDLSRIVDGLRRMQNLKGFIVTVPHKSAMLELCDEADDSARAIGAVNTIRRENDGRLVGAMLDGTGFVAGLRTAGIEPSGMSVYLAGAGGAANAIAFALADAGIAKLSIANRTRSKSDDLARRLHGHCPRLVIDVSTTDPSGHELVVNATSLGLRDRDPLPLDVTRLDQTQIVAEIIMQPEITPLLAAARLRGCGIQPGRPMLTSQLHLMADFMGMVSS
ncbi:shikimate dehydrogenase family protein [Microvirga antarctica]|uniref:shikimate dehydrogenase family protein n=1 Tax=Microvirga antarctica TaxID=2819233 RepID=UPI001B30C937|nr:shikimate dehydrogenase [Microvirga antarctica]